jgi:hypothetical protein
LLPASWTSGCFSHIYGPCAVKVCAMVLKKTCSKASRGLHQRPERSFVHNPLLFTQLFRQVKGAAPDIEEKVVHRTPSTCRAVHRESSALHGPWLGGAKPHIVIWLRSWQAVPYQVCTLEGVARESRSLAGPSHYPARCRPHPRGASEAPRPESEHPYADTLTSCTGLKNASQYAFPIGNVERKAVPKTRIGISPTRKASMCQKSHGKCTFCGAALTRLLPD